VTNKRKPSDIDELLDELDKMIDKRSAQAVEAQVAESFAFDAQLNAKEKDFGYALDKKESALQVKTRRLNHGLILLAASIILVSVVLSYQGWSLTTYLDAIAVSSIVFAASLLIGGFMLVGPRQELLILRSELTRLRVRITDIETLNWISTLQQGSEPGNMKRP
jgi:hypothetical protein